MIIGLRHEDKNAWERRVPLTPDDVAGLISTGGITFRVQPSLPTPQRIFPDRAYAEAGAEVTDDLSGCDLVMGVKEMPVGIFRSCKAYMFFSHTIKCQPYNLPMLQKLLDLRCTLFDYELISDDRGRRLVFFGRHAGLAGMIDSLSALGRRLETEGIPAPFTRIKMAQEYGTLAAAREHIRTVGERIRTDGIDPRLVPLVVGFAGYGNVSGGAQEILDLLPVETILPDELLTLRERSELSAHHVYKVIFKEEHMVTPKEPGDRFVLQDYYDHPEKYAPAFDRYTPHLTVLMNTIYWTEKYPRLVTIDFVRQLFSGDAPAPLRVVGDISCDIGGSIEFTTKATEPDNPCYVFEPASGAVRDGYAGHGPVVMAVDNLPCELPLESSEHFSTSLRDFIAEFAAADLSATDGLRPLSEPLRKSVIAHRGALLPPFEYIKDCLRQLSTSS